MTNELIILNESIRLMKDGILKPSGEKGVAIDGTEIDLPEPIHTFQTWKALGYVVKKGEKSIAKFPIWKYISKKTVDENNEEKETSNMFMKTAAFFKFEQVERLERKEV